MVAWGQARRLATRLRLGRFRSVLPEWSALTVMALIAGGIWAFVEIADEVGEEQTAPVDRRLLLAFRNPADLSDPVGPLWLEEMMRDFTALGGTGILTMLSVGAALYLIMAEKRHAALLILASVGGGVLLSTLIKIGIDRPRPDLVAHGSYVYTASFPSGHSMMSAVTFLTLGALLARVHPQRKIKIFLIGSAVLLTVLVGVSRVYLGVHWPTDVLAGWCVGAAWALSCWLAALWLQRRGQVEPEETAPEGESPPASPLGEPRRAPSSDGAPRDGAARDRSAT